MNKHDIKLGDKVRCKVTGFEGIVTCSLDYLNGCRRYTVQPEVRRDDSAKLPESYTFDWQELEVLKRGAVCIDQGTTEMPAKEARPSGGPRSNRTPTRRG